MGKKQKSNRSSTPFGQQAHGAQGGHQGQLQQQLQLAFSLLQQGETTQGVALLTWLASQAAVQASACAALAQVHLAAGGVQEALGWAQKAAQAAPTDASVAMVWSRCLRQAGDAARAAAVCSAAIQAHPEHADLRIALGLALKDAGDLAQAEDAYQTALKLAPRSLTLLHNLGNLRQLRGDIWGARNAYLEALEVQPNHAATYLELARLARTAADLPAALTAIDQALRVAPDSWQAWQIKAELLVQHRDVAAAREACKQALGLHETAKGWQVLGEIEMQLGEPASALAAYMQATRLDGGLIEAHHGQALAYRMLGRERDCIQAAQQAIDVGAQGPLAAECLFLRTVSQFVVGEISKALEGTRQLEARAQDSLELANVADLKAALAAAMGDMQSSLQHFKQSLDLMPGRFATSRGMCASAQYLDLLSASELKTMACDAIRPFLQRQDGVWLSNTPEPDRPLRVGFVSGDFRRHSCSFFLEPLFEALDPAQVQVLAYSTTPQFDAVSERLKSHVQIWRNVAHLQGSALRSLIRDDAVDVLIDLSGFTEGSRLDAFSIRAAPVQLTWLGYLGTTGMPTMDARITDELASPAELDAHHTEQMIRLHRTYLCYRPDPSAPEVSSSPHLASQGLTFGSFNAIQKISPTCVRMWGRLLCRLPDSRLLLKTRTLGDADVRARLLAALAEHGVTPERVEMRGYEADDRHHLDTYARVDIGLDTWPYNGVTTTCEALWMGVPVVSRFGDTLASRQGLSLLGAVGLGHLAVPDEQTWLEACVTLASNRAQLQSLRAGLRSRMQASPLMDGAGFAQAFEQALRGLWRDWCRGAMQSDA